jgi:adenine phosphoribosyltransferase
MVLVVRMASRKRVAKASRSVPVRHAPTPRGVKGPEAKTTARRTSRPTTVPALTVDRLSYVRERVRAIPDFPQPGILFRDITPLLSDPRGFHITLDAFAESFLGEHIDAIVAIESRGFIFGGALAERLNASFVPVRKPGKLPGRTDSVAYSLEYGTNELQIHRGALPKRSRVLVVDDLLATGGTAAAAGELVRRQEATVVAYAFVIELAGLAGRKKLEPAPVLSLLIYE